MYVGQLGSKETPGKHKGSWVVRFTSNPPPVLVIHGRVDFEQIACLWLQVAFFNRTPLARPFTIDLHRLQDVGKT